MNVTLPDSYTGVMCDSTGQNGFSSFDNTLVLWRCGNSGASCGDTRRTDSQVSEEKTAYKMFFMRRPILLLQKRNVFLKTHFSWNDTLLCAFAFEKSWVRLLSLYDTMLFLNLCLTDIPLNKSSTTIKFLFLKLPQEWTWGISWTLHIVYFQHKMSGICVFEWTWKAISV